METASPSEKEPLVIDEYSRTQLAGVSYWARFISISGMVFSAFFAFSGIMLLVAPPAALPQAQMPGVTMPMGQSLVQVMAVIYIVAGLLVFFICRFLLKFAGQMKTALEYSRQDYLAHSFSNLKMFYKISGIIVLANIILMLLGSFLSSLVMKGMS